MGRNRANEMGSKGRDYIINVELKQVNQKIKKITLKSKAIS